MTREYEERGLMTNYLLYWMEDGGMPDIVCWEATSDVDLIDAFIFAGPAAMNLE
jgi:hypothetical protein